MLYCNARSIVNKINDLEIIAAEKNPDIILITESWCNQDTSNALLSIPGYHLDQNLRCDRTDTHYGIGGGLLVYCKIGLSILPCDSESDFNQYCSFKVLSADKTVDFIVTLVYRSPNCSDFNTDLLCDLVSGLSDTESHFIIGDFNMPDVDWTTLNCSNKYKKFVDTYSDKSLFQLIDFPTHKRGNILDLVLTNSPERVLNIEDIGNLGNSDHSIISIDLIANLDSKSDCDQVPDWSKMDHASFLNYLTQSDIENRIANLNTQRSWSFFKEIVSSAIEKFVPTKRRRENNKPIWMNRTVVKLSRQKRNRFRIYCADRSDENLRIYKKVEKQCKKAVRNAKRNFEKKLASNNNKKPFNAYLRSKTKCKSTVGPLIQNSQVISNDKEISEILNNYFASVFVKETDSAIPNSTVSTDANTAISNSNVSIGNSAIPNSQIPVNNSAIPNSNVPIGNDNLAISNSHVFVNAAIPNSSIPSSVNSAIPNSSIPINANSAIPNSSVHVDPNAAIPNSSNIPPNSNSAISNSNVPDIIDQNLITKKAVVDKIGELKNTNSCGPDKIPIVILKKYKNELAGPLAIIFNKSLNSGEVPEDWRMANVTPLFKKGSKGKPCNYRPISLTSVPCKILESILKERITTHLDLHKLLKNSQHGFTKHKSCTTNLLEFLEKITRNIDGNIPMDIIYLDFAKAFDKVPKSKLLAKMKNLGINGKILKWTENWLSGRKQRVVLNGQESNWIDVTSGVAQGSVLGPLLFLIFINDLDDCAPLISILSKFADDTKVGHPVITEEDRDVLQSQLNALLDWSVSSGMSFNVDKCKVMHIGKRNKKFGYTMNGQPLQEVEHEKDIGVTFDNTMKPGAQCREAARIAKVVLNQICRAFHYRDRHIFLNLYKRYVRCHLEFATPAWSPWQIGDINCLENVQRKAVGMISGLQSDNYEGKLKELKLISLEDRRLRADLIQTFKILKGIDRVESSTWFTNVPESRPVTRNTNNHDSLHIRLNQTEIGKNFFSTRAAKKWNELPNHLKNQQRLSSFKRLLDDYLLNRN